MRRLLETGDQPISRSNTLASVGFFTSLTGVLALFAIGPFGSMIDIAGACVAFVSVPGLVFSVSELFWKPRRLAGWGAALGIFGSLYLPALYLTLFRF